MSAQSVSTVSAGEYRTNGERLFRVVKTVGSSVTVEDALTLKWEKLDLGIVIRMRVVKEA